MEIVEIGFEGFASLLRGWRDSGSRLRLEFKSSAMELSGFCSLIDVRDELVGFWIGEPENKNAVEFKLRSCRFGFRDIPEADPPLGLGLRAESALEAVHGDFALLIMLLK